MFILMQYQATFGLFVTNIGASQRQIGVLIGLNGLLVVALSILLSAVTAKLRSNVAISLGFVLAGVGFGLNVVAEGVPVLEAAVIIATAGEVIFLPRGTTYVIEIAPVEMRARYMSALEGSWSLALLVAPGLAIALYRYLGRAFWLVCAMAGVAAAQVMRVSNRKKTEDVPVVENMH